METQSLLSSVWLLCVADCGSASVWLGGGGDACCLSKPLSIIFFASSNTDEVKSRNLHQLL